MVWGPGPQGPGPTSSVARVRVPARDATVGVPAHDATVGVPAHDATVGVPA